MSFLNPIRLSDSIKLIQNAKSPLVFQLLNKPLKHKLFPLAF